MITEKQAHLARLKYYDYLTKLGAHSIMVDEIKEKGKRTFAVIALVLKKPSKAPDYLNLEKNNKIIKVPLVFNVAKRFKPEL